MYRIYEHVSPSGKRYIGQTSQPLGRRWRNGNGYVNNAYFYRAIQKYGWAAFEHRVICECKTLDEANRKEAELIAKYKSNNPTYGYNISGGGDGSNRVAESTRKIMSEIRKGKYVGELNPNFGRKHTEEECALMSKRVKEYYSEHENVRRGAKHTEKSRKKMSESRRNSEKAKQAIQKLNCSKAKKVRCIETDTIYSSTHDVERQLGFRQGNIAATCRGKYKQAYGFRWEYV